MHVDMLGRPINVGDTVVIRANQNTHILELVKVTELAISVNGTYCIRVDNPIHGLRIAKKVLVVNREMEYTAKHYPELLL